MRISFNRRVRTEVRRIADEYEDESPGVSDEFLAVLDQALDIIERHGTRMAKIRDEVRLVKLRRFPYGVYYQIEGDTARILVVKHHRRDPNFGLDRT